MPFLWYCGMKFKYLSLMKYFHIILITSASMDDKNKYKVNMEFINNTISVTFDNDITPSFVIEGNKINSEVFHFLQIRHVQRCSQSCFLAFSLHALSYTYVLPPHKP